jgi:hypothetical protein
MLGTMTAEAAQAARQQAEEWKASANGEYKKGNYKEAIALYSQAIGVQ